MDAEFEPLFEAGIHDIKREDMIQVFSIPFVNKARRLFLIDKFNQFLQLIDHLGIDFEIWINGSFVTEKEEPGDIDVVFFSKRNDINGLSILNQKLIRILFDNPQTKIRYNCDVYIALDDRRTYWTNQFGFSRNKQPKGIVRLIK